MTKREAKLCMIKGSCVRHKSYADTEYLYMDKYGKIRDEAYMEMKRWSNLKYDKYLGYGWSIVTID